MLTSRDWSVARLRREFLAVLAIGLVSACASREPPTEVRNLSEQVDRLREQVATLTKPTALTEEGLIPGPTPSRPPAPATEVSLEEAARLVKSYTVLVETSRGYGSGISLGQGRVLTAHHVIDRGRSITVRFPDGHQEPVRILRIDPRRDLALLQSSFTDQTTAATGDSRSLRAAETLIAVGYPRPTAIGAQDSTVTRGIFSSRWQSPRGVWHVQSDAPVNPGNSGGPLADRQGRLVGVVTWSVREAQGLHFAVASDEIEAFLDEVGGEVPTTADVGPPAAVQASPELAARDIQQRSVEPGGSISLMYELANSGNVAVTAVLGASIRLNSGGRWIDDPANDTRVRLGPGNSVHSRMFRVPLGTPAGTYDVAWGLLSEDLKTSYALDIAPRQLRVGTSSSAVPPPSGNAPAEAVRIFYSRLGNRDFDAAWDLLSPRFRSAVDYGNWVEGYRSTRSIRTASVVTDSESGATATVSVTVVSEDETASGIARKTFQGTWTLIRVGGEWKLDRANIRQVG